MQNIVSLIALIVVTALLIWSGFRALRVKRRVAGAVTVFVTAPVEELERRLRERATESTGEIGGRIETARRQLAEQGEFDYVVENDDRDRAAGRLAAIVERELAAATMASR